MGQNSANYRVFIGSRQIQDDGAPGSYRKSGKFLSQAILFVGQCHSNTRKIGKACHFGAGSLPEELTARDIGEDGFFGMSPDWDLSSAFLLRWSKRVYLGRLRRAGGI